MYFHILHSHCALPIIAVSAALRFVAADIIRLIEMSGFDDVSLNNFAWASEITLHMHRLRIS